MSFETVSRLDLRLAATAHHEAGHAVASIVAMVPFKHVTVGQAAESFGHVLYFRKALSLGQMHKRGMIALAGEASERRFNPRSIRKHHGAGDRAAVVDYALQCSGSPAQAEALVNLWSIQAAELVEGRWREIETLANALMERSQLNYDEALHVVLGPRAAAPARR
jgi:hypothetical protein